MRNRIASIVLGLCLVLPCLMAVKQSERVADVQSSVADLEANALRAAEGLEISRQVSDLKTSLYAMETDLVCERLKMLPQDAANWHTTVIVQPDYETRPAEKMALGVLDREPHLKALKAMTHFHVLKTDDARYRQKFAKECPLTPCLVITRADGTVIYKESGAQLGSHPHGLYQAVRTEWNRHCPDGRCLPPLRFPDKPDEPIREPVPDTIAQPQVQPQPDDDFLPLLVCGLVAAGVVFYVVIKKDLSA